MRDRIISEIRRLTAEGGGQPPGRRTFERDTGIRYTDWYGIYWARWGDALVEAGFAANDYQAKLDGGFVLQKVAEAYRHYGRVATHGELRMRRQTDGEFPSHGTLDKHFPTKSALLTALRAWLSDRPEFQDVAAMLPEAPTIEPAPRAAKLKEGSVYLIQSGPNYKIGRSDELERRVKEIRIALPDAATLVHTITTDDPPGIEAYWHRRFAEKRANGEWFKLARADVLAFKRRKFQ